MEMQNMRRATHLKLRDLKHLASTIHGFKAYPSEKEIAKAAETLVAKHPCLKEAGSEMGWNGWKNRIKFKMGNFRNKRRQAGCQEVAVNAGKRNRSNPDNKPSHSNIKRPKRAEVNFLLNFPKGKDHASLQELRQNCGGVPEDGQEPGPHPKDGDHFSITPRDHSSDLPTSK